MMIVLSHTSALEYWRSPGCKLQLASPQPIAFRAPNIREVDTLRTLGSLSEQDPVHVLVTNNTKQRTADIIMHRAWRNPLPPNAIARLQGGILACSPELTFVQMAALLSPIELIKLGFELTGSYTLAHSNPHGFFERKALTNVSRLQQFSESAVRMPGVKQAKMMLPCILPESASPRETALAMLLSLPCSLGGYGIEKPILNHRITLTKSMRPWTNNGYFVCDLFWPEANLAVEYESDAWHTGTTRIAKDSKRRDILAGMGISVVTVTRLQINNVGEMDSVAHTIARLLGKRVRPYAADYATKKLRLRAMVL